MSRGQVLCLNCLKKLSRGDLVVAAPVVGEGSTGTRHAFELPWDGTEGGPRPTGEDDGRSRGLWSSLFAIDEADHEPPIPIEGVRCLCEGRAHEEFIGLRLDRLPPCAVGVVGGLGVGKTHLLVCMAHHMRLSPDRHSLAAMGPPHAWLSEQTDRFLRHGKRLVPTPPGSSPQRRQAWRIQDRRNPQRPRSVGLLLTDDRSGEIWEGKAAGADEALANYLALLRSVLFVVNGAAIGAHLGIDTTDAWSQKPVEPDAGERDDHILGRLLEHLGPRARRMPFAVLVSRFDSLWAHEREELAGVDSSFFETEHARRENLLERLLNESGRGGLLDSARGAFAEVRLFAATVLGYRPGPDDVDTDRLTRLPQPRGVAEPLRWLIEGMRL